MTDQHDLVIPAAAKLRPGELIRVLDGGWELVDVDLPPRPVLTDCPLDDQGNAIGPPPGWEFAFLGDYDNGEGPVVTAGWLEGGRFVCYDPESLASGFRDHVQQEANR